MFVAIDTEDTGLDFDLGARPFLVTACQEGKSPIFWEWPVDPLTRRVQVVQSDLDEIWELVRGADEIVFHHSKFDTTALAFLDPRFATWPWEKTQDTLVMAHLLESNRPKNLTDMLCRWLGADVEPLEKATEVCCKAARKVVQQARQRVKRRRKLADKAALAGGQSALFDDVEPEPLADWAIADEGRADMPSAGGDAWKFDLWLPRALAPFVEGHPTGTCTIVNLNREECDVRIDRATRWGNPFSHLADSRARWRVGSREEAIARYREWVVLQPELMASLGELDGKRLGCYCRGRFPDCHGDVLAELLARTRSPWYVATQEYACADSEGTARLWPVLRAECERRGLWRHYRERMRMPKILSLGERYGLTMHEAGLEEMEARFRRESDDAGARLTEIARGFGHELELPKGASPNNNLRAFCFDHLKLPQYRSAKAKTNAPTLDKAAMERYEAELPPGVALDAVRLLRGKRKRDTGLSFMESYRSFAVPEGGGVWRLHPNTNQTGTDTLRFSMSNPNGQQISKQEESNIRRIFGPAPGREWWSLDAKNIELRIPGFLSKEPDLIALFEHPDDPPFFGSQHILNFSLVYPDIWAEAVREVGIERAAGYVKKKYGATWYQWVKNGDFSIQYNAGAATADAAFHRRGCHAILKGHFHLLEALNQRCIAQANKLGYVETLPDRTVDPTRGYPLLTTRTDRGDALPTVPLNYVVQGTACWALARMMVVVQEYLDWLNRECDGGHHMILNVHDELVFDFPHRPRMGNAPKVRKIRSLMESVGDDLVPPIPLRIGVEYHEENWAEGVTLK